MELEPQALRADRDLNRLKQCFERRDHAYLQELFGRKGGDPIEALLRRILGWPAAWERATRIHQEVLPAPASLRTEDPWIDDELLAAAVQLRLEKPRQEGAWHLQGDVWVAAMSPFVFVDRRAVLVSLGFHGTDEKILQHYLPRRKNFRSRRLKRAVLLRDYWDRNYWHLIHNVLPRVPMIDFLGIPRDVPVLVSENFARLFLDRLRVTKLFEDREIIVQSRKEAIRCEELFLLQPGEFSCRWAEGLAAFIPDPPSPVVEAKRVYCRRGQSTSLGRQLQNEDEVERLFRSAGFAVVDTATMSIPEQKALFQNVEIVAGVNGAAFTNAIFRQDRPLTMGVLISSGFRSTAIPTFAKSFGYRYVGCTIPSVGDGRRAQVTAPAARVRELIDRIG